MAYTLSFTGDSVNKVIDGRYNNFRQDIADATHTVGSPQAIAANTPYRLTIDAALRNDTNAPNYITSRWDATNNKIAFPEELDKPTYVGDISMIFDPTAAAAGKGILRAYIDDATTPKLIRNYSFNYKAVPEIVNIITTWYLGTDVGYDAKNDGVYFEVEFDQAGSLYSKGAVIYRT